MPGTEQLIALVRNSRYTATVLTGAENSLFLAEFDGKPCSTDLQCLLDVFGPTALEISVAGPVQFLLSLAVTETGGDEEEEEGEEDDVVVDHVVRQSVLLITLLMYSARPGLTLLTARASQHD